MDIIKKLVSKDNSVKFLFKLEDNNTIETLYMHDRDFRLTYHSTVCVSSQVGCMMGCKFCATAVQGFKRNLSAQEIFDQVRICSSYCLESGITPIDAVVFAGMGEPMHNYECVKAAIHKIKSELDISDFEVATVGVVPGIYRMIEDFKNSNINIRLNLSLHGSDDEQRKKIIPYTCRYGINSIINAAIDYARAFNTKVRIRYALFKGLNDTDQDVDRLSRLLENKPVKLIISQYNDNNIPGLTAPSQSEVEEFYRKISERIDCGIFYNFGTDIKGGCGQLRQAESA